MGDKALGKIYHMLSDYYDDNGDEIKRQRIFTHLYNEANRFRASNLQIDFEYGVGLNTGQGIAPACWLRVSNDLARTWSPEYAASIGATGAYGARAAWRRLGWADAFTFEVNISDPVKVSICGAYLT